VHGPIQLDGCRKFSTSLLTLAYVSVEGAETQVAMCLERAHAKDLLVAGLSQLDVE
jgi:hypothetical protein